MRVRTTTFSQVGSCRGAFLVSTVARPPADVTVDRHWPTVAPGWQELVLPYKQGKLSADDYAERYLQLLQQRLTQIAEEWQALQQEAGERDIVLLCYDRGFCHRYLLMGFLYALDAQRR